MKFIDSWLSEPDLSLLTHTTCRIGRYLPEFQEIIDQHVSDPVLRALSGLEISDQISTLDQRVWMGVAKTDRGMVEENGAELELASQSSIALWPHASRSHVLSSSSRETQARIHLSEQEISYALPDELGQTHIELLAAGDRVLHVLHVEWLKKLIDLALDILLLDVTHCGLWVSPILEFLPEAKLRRVLRRIQKRKKHKAGGLGLAAVYAHRMNLSYDGLMQHSTKTDRLLFETAIEANCRIA